MTTTIKRSGSVYLDGEKIGSVHKADFHATWTATTAYGTRLTGVNHTQAEAVRRLVKRAEAIAKHTRKPEGSR